MERRELLSLIILAPWLDKQPPRPAALRLVEHPYQDPARTLSNVMLPLVTRRKLAPGETAEVGIITPFGVRPLKVVSPAGVSFQVRGLEVAPMCLQYAEFSVVPAGVKICFDLTNTSNGPAQVFGSLLCEQVIARRRDGGVS